jgi:glycerate kinase
MGVIVIAICSSLVMKYKYVKLHSHGIAEAFKSNSQLPHHLKFLDILLTSA